LFIFSTPYPVEKTVENVKNSLYNTDFRQPHGITEKKHCQ